MKKLILLIALCVSASAMVYAQAPKLGYINSQELLSMMPEVIKADTILKAYAKTYQDQLETMQKEYEKKINDYQTQEKTMTDAVKEVKQKEIMDLQNRMQTTQESAQDKIAKKKEEVYKPLLDKAEKAINDVAKEKGYDYIFDRSTGSVLFAKDSDNILPLVKAKLGIK